MQGTKHTKQLHLVDTSHAPEKTAAELLFDHWVWMLGKNPRRVAMGPKRRKVLEHALTLYDADTLRLAIDGNASSAWHAGENDRGEPFNDIELIFRDEAHIERFAARGERLRERLREIERDSLAAAAHPEPTAPVDPQAVAAGMAKLRAAAARAAGRTLRHE